MPRFNAQEGRAIMRDLFTTEERLEIINRCRYSAENCGLDLEDLRIIINLFNRANPESENWPAKIGNIIKYRRKTKMQTFLSSPSFSESARVLDDARLRKQLSEGLMILDILDGKTKAWVNHPSIRQWIWHKEALLCYVDSIAKECKNRGFSDQNFKTDLKFEDVEKPWWLGHEPYHSSHRSKLLWKGRVDASATA